MASIQDLFATALRHHHAGQLQSAEQIYRQILAVHPTHAQTQNELGNVLWMQGKFKAAFDCYQQSAALNPEYAEVHVNLANALLFQGNLDQAQSHCRRALQLKPDYFIAHNNLGNVFLVQGDFATAVECYRRTLELQPDYADAHNNLAGALQQLGRFDEASRSYVRALGLNPNHAYAHYGNATLKLLRAEFESGWPEYEWRLQTNRNVQREFGRPQWAGERLENRTIFLHAEQCLGDNIQFVRLAAVVKSQNPAATVIVECQRPLLKLLSACPGIDRLMACGDELPPFDVYASLMSLPGILGTTPHTIPASIPYLIANPALVRHWRRRLEPAGGFRIGVNWRGQPTTRHRDIPISLFQSFAAIRGVHLISLQKGAAAAESSELQSDRPKMIDFGNDFDSANGAFVDTAAIMMNLDLVISSDTSVAHLAGALGVPVWVGLPLVPDWRWMLDRADTPWYPTMRLFRQQQVGDWTRVMRQMQDTLSECFRK
jgi:tetratricopeptide (TPR) repeat protein